MSDLSDDLHYLTDEALEALPRHADVSCGYAPREFLAEVLRLRKENAAMRDVMARAAEVMQDAKAEILRLRGETPQP